MNKHKIVCVNHEPVKGHENHSHIVAVGTGSSTHIEKKWKVPEVVAALDRGEIFFTEGEKSEKIAYVEKFHCARCGGTHIRTHHDHVTDNNLDNLKSCPVIPTRDRDDRQPQPDRRHG